MKYSWRSGASIKADVKKIGNELETIRNKNGGRLTPDMVVEKAKTKRTELNKCFEWNNGEAAEKYRKWQARHLIGSIEVEIEEVEHHKPIRMYVNVFKENRHYASVYDVLSDEDLRLQQLDKLKNQLKRMETEYSYFNELSDVWSVIRKVA